jgi:hypothetical protein
MKTTRLTLSFIIFISLFNSNFTFCQANTTLDQYNVVWNSQSKNSGESMPCGGGNIGLNVWVENGDILCYLSRSGAFDENNVFPKLGRLRIKLSPNPFDGGEYFRQELKLRQGYIEIIGKKNGQIANIRFWVDVFRPVVHIETSGNKPFTTSAEYESWRTKDREWNDKGEVRASLAFRDAPMKAYISKDSINFEAKSVVWFHRNKEKTLFDITVKQQELESIKDKMWNPLKDLTFGGIMFGTGLKPDGNGEGKYATYNYKSWKLKSEKPTTKQSITILLHIDNSISLDEWKKSLQELIKNEKESRRTAFIQTQQWWTNFWDRSYIAINTEKPDTASKAWQVGRNYQLFRYQLGCNAYGKYPTKFNGGLFTYDPVYVNKTIPFSPDHRDWGGGTFTAQNQRLVYWPMLKSGDEDMMPSQLDFYLKMLPNAELRTQQYWGHKGASFTEQLENFGLPLATSYGWYRPKNVPRGVESNYWLEYLWDTSLEFCLMAIEMHNYKQIDVTKYVPLIKSCLTFFDEHYQYEALNRGKQPLDGNGKLILYPGSGAETYKMAYNASSTIAALQTVTKGLLDLPENYMSKAERDYFLSFQKRIPPIPFREMQGKKTIAPAEVFGRINNSEITQLYPVFPWRIYGVGKPDLDVAVNTWKYGVDNEYQRNFISWHQDAIFCACMGLTNEAQKITIQKLENSPRRYPTFWGPGHDWVPDHNWGGSGMIGLQEMLMQTNGNKIYLFPAWPKEWNVTFKLHAPTNTILEGVLKYGKLESLKVTPEERRKDIEIMLK